MKQSLENEVVIELLTTHDKNYISLVLSVGDYNFNDTIQYHNFFKLTKSTMQIRLYCNNEKKLFEFRSCMYEIIMYLTYAAFENYLWNVRRIIRRIIFQWFEIDDVIIVVCASSDTFASFTKTILRQSSPFSSIVSEPITCS